MPNVRVEPSGIEFTAETGESVLDAALRAGLRWPTVCGGQAICTTCFVKVASNPAGLGPMGEGECTAIAPILRRYPSSPPGTMRLACQAKVNADVVVFKRLPTRDDAR